LAVRIYFFTHCGNVTEITLAMLLFFYDLTNTKIEISFKNPFTKNKGSYRKEPKLTKIK